MARNSEKAQSMLYRFREQQAAEMGMGNRRAGDRRPRIAASVSSLRDCERWRGDVLKEISRKVSKIQDGMSDLLGVVPGQATLWIGRSDCLAEIYDPTYGRPAALQRTDVGLSPLDTPGADGSPRIWLHAGQQNLDSQCP